MTNELDPKTVEKLTYFLKANQPYPPPPKPGERERIFRVIRELHERPTGLERIFGPLQWLIPAAASAVVAFILLSDFIPSRSGADADLGIYLADTFSIFEEPADKGRDSVENDWLSL
ncbi:MAG: hypothetical protein HYU99_02470 [Deltaproteobacteria bacterium]|nr:hypothetical protein [Deltaproteobacteria bacterium]